MGLFSDSKSTTTNLTEIKEETRQVNQQIKDGIGVGVEGSSNVINMTDGGAIQRTADVAKSVIEKGGAINKDALGLGRDVVRDALGFGGDALSFGGDTLRDAFDFAGRAADRSLSVAQSSVGAAIAAAKPADADTLQKFALYGALAFGALVLVMGFRK